MSPGKLIVIEGLEGAGKSTAIKSVKNFLEIQQKDTLITREPGSTVIGEKIRAIVKEGCVEERLEPLNELLLMYAARVQLVNQVIKPALQQGIWVIADRFELSTYAYQGGGRGIDSSVIKQLSAICLQGFKPQLTLFLDISPEAGLARIKNRNQFDRIEQESLLFFNKVYHAYHRHIKALDDVAIIDASLPLQAVHAAISQQLTKFCQHAH